MRPAVLAFIALAACKSHEPKKAPAPNDVVVVKPGTAPLREVRYAVAKGAHTTIGLATDWKATAGEISNVLPTIVTTFEITCEDVGSDGAMHLRATVTEASAHEKAESGIAPASLAPLLDPLKGSVIRVTLQPDGRVSTPTFEAPPPPAAGSGSGAGSAAGSGSATGSGSAAGSGSASEATGSGSAAGSGSATAGRVSATGRGLTGRSGSAIAAGSSAGSGSAVGAGSAESAPTTGTGVGSGALAEQLTTLAASFQQLAIPLPTAPIGVGAEWKTTRTITQGGLVLTSTTTLDVTSLDATTIGFTLTSEIKGADQTVTQSGIAVDLKDVGGSATGKGTIDLAKGVTTGELHFDLHSQMTAAGSSTPMRAQTDIVIH